MDAKDLKLLRDIALIDFQLRIGSSDTEDKTQEISEIYTNLTNAAEEPAPSTSSTFDFSAPKEYNNSCQEILKHIEKNLLQLLQENREKQATLLNYLNESVKKSDAGESSIWKMIKCAGIPYFKDLHGYPQPRNDDVKEKLANGQLCCIDYLTLPHMWSQQHKDSLRKAVLGNSHSASHKSCNENSENAENTDNRTKTELKKPSIDWLKISATDFNGKYSATECESQWKLHLAPEVNKGKWSATELDKLNELAEKFKFQDWDNIALKLGTNRTGYQCCIQYQTKNSLKEGKWSQTEDAFLEKLVQKFTRRNHIPWTKVSWYFQTRSRKQCQERYLEHLKSDLKKGHFSDAEDKIIICGVKLFKDCGKIARFLPGRAPTQIRSRYYYLISTSMSEFTKEEDELLVSLAKQNPRDWLKISENFQNRTKVQCRKRYNALCKQDRQDGDQSTEENVGSELVKLPAYDKLICEKGKKIKIKKKKQAKLEDDVFSEIVQYHEACSENYFGPRIRNPADEELKDICLKLRATMAMLSVSCDFSNKASLINLVKCNSNFDPYDIKILSHLLQEDKSDGPSLKDNYLLNGLLIPPNYNTLLGLNSLIANRAKIKCKTTENEGLLETRCATQDNSAEDRISFTRAKSLFRSRLLTLFYLPSMLTLIPTSEISWDVFHKSKKRKPKQLTKKRLKNHAKFMSIAYQEKRKREKEAKELQNELCEAANSAKKFKSS